MLRLELGFNGRYYLGSAGFYSFGFSYNMAAACRVAPLALAEVSVGLRTASQQRQLYTVADCTTLFYPHSSVEQS